MTPGQTGLTSESAQKLSAVAVAVAEAFASVKQGEEQRQDKADEAEPGEQDVDKAQRKIQKGPKPEIVVPVMLFHARASIWISPAGHSRAQRPQPAQRDISI